MKKKNVFLIISLFLFIISIMYIFLIKNVDVSNISIESYNYKLGFSSINKGFHNIFGYNEILYKLTKYLGIIPILLGVMYALIGLYELKTKKSLLKVVYNVSH